ncbi:alkene reductase [Pseudomonas phenolilytica]|uniref:alkene reductase n=1 Tax=Pseudomonas phenolilytica TaxID=2746321 RepID=UPI0009889647|nr:alkene reductase [Pseudomonas phenolilytica]OOE10239.1 alkene reductase [Stutzerimonas degradans]QGW19726.1 alkene reductase [Stutzerimonas degradans]UIP87695.1 alkene reductase [Pseudomonas phenolilytica]
MNALFQPARFGELALANRVVMAPMTRSRASSDHVPTAEMVEYYAQRASAGLIVAEGTSPSADGIGYCRTPGIYSEAQIRAWREVTDAVHARGGQIVLQLMHCGRVAARANKPAGTRSVAPSAVAARTQLFTDSEGMADTDLPHALSLDEIAGVIGDYRRAALNARAAGFDGVELHGTSGYLPMQFIATNSNLRDDRYGGPLANRIRFTLEVLQTMAEAIGAGRVGLRLCPGNPYNDVEDLDPEATLKALLAGIDGMGLAYLHIMRSPVQGLDAFAIARQGFAGALIANDGFDGPSAAAHISSGAAEAVSFARHYIANPDLVERLREGHALARFDRHTLYSPGPAGYSDYPSRAGEPALE